nr:DUF6320 domain-containing protein [uncultured Blautia sp.]
MKNGYSNWRKLDNAALAFPLVTGKNDTRVFRFYCELKEAIDPELLQNALDKTMEKYPLFQMVLRKGLFWFYLEHRDIRPVVKTEKKPPCSRLYIPDKKNLLFQVSYYEKRINFEVFHALTDGTGAMHFLQELVTNYLKQAHPEQNLPSLPEEDDSTPGDQEEDSFSQYYSSDIPRNSEKKPRAVRLPGERLIHEDMHITEVVLPVKELHDRAKEYGVSITVLVTAMFLCAIHKEIPKSRQKRPIALMVPVNLRNYFPSQSMGNFFGWIEVGHVFSDNTTFHEVLSHVKEQFTSQLSEEKIAVHMNGYVRLEKNPLIRAVPLEIKKYFLMVGANLGSRSITAVYSNIGILRFPKEYSEYIDRFGIFASTNSMQLCSCSYENQMVLGFTSKLPKDNIQRNFMEMLKKEELPYTEKNNDFPGCSQKEKKAEQRIVQIFNFVCIAAAILCGMINYLTRDRLDWFWFAAAGCFCGWLIVAVAYAKRRNILKNEILQLILVTVIAVLWDKYSGWHGWSLDFVLPFGALAILGSIPIIVKAQRLEKEEYLFYLVQAAFAGLVPLILMLFNLIRFPYPSVICGGVSLLVFAGMFIFNSKDTLREFHKKLRL